MLTPYLLGIDIGTSSVKAILISPSGEYVGHTQKTYSIDSPFSGWAEQDPNVWLNAVVSTVRQLVDKHRISTDQVLGIGLSGQMHGTVCVGTNNDVLRPAIIWADQRSAKQVEYVLGRIGTDQLAKWTGNPLSTGFMLPSWLWLREYEPEIESQVRWLMLPKDYIRLKLTGEVGSEPSDAASTSLFDPKDRCWSISLIDALQLNARILPPVNPSLNVAGELLPVMAQEMGLHPGIPVIYGGSDQAMQAVGNGVVLPGLLSSTIGTGGQLFATTFSFIVDSALRMQSYCHIMPDTWHVETAILSAGLSFKWLRDNVLKSGSYQDLADTAEDVPAGAEGVFFTPYLIGERTPHMDPKARGCLIGFTNYHNKKHMIRAVMEGVIFALKQGLELMIDLGVRVEKVVASGGASNHPLWLQLQSDIYNQPIYKSKTIEAAAFGAAVAAGVGVDVYHDLLEAVKATVRWRESVVLPQPEKVDVYKSLYSHFKTLYPAMMRIHHHLSQTI